MFVGYVMKAASPSNCQQADKSNNVKDYTRCVGLAHLLEHVINFIFFKAIDLK